jgi:hypothetical protein
MGFFCKNGKERWGGDLTAHFTGKNIYENDI